jgi:hypothetical protein
VAWPQPTDYNEAIQAPRLCFNDPDLQSGQVVEDALGMPRPYSGNFADVYQVRGGDGKAWAIKCFTREVPTLQSRYQAISAHLRQGRPSFMVKFRYLAEGIRIRRHWYPILKMDWVEGFTLNEFVRRYVHQAAVMYRLAQMWVKLSLQLRQADMAHADLQHGNVLLVPGARTSQLSLRLIDYDGMFVPALAHAPSGEVGHPNYQHPLRLREGWYDSEVDRFPHLVIYTALRCLTVGGRDLWEKYDNGENLLFREQDFVQSKESPLLLELWQLPDPDIRRLLGHLLLGSQQPCDRVALLDEVVGSEGRPLKLTTGQERQLQDMLLPAAARMKTAPSAVSQFSLQELIAELEDEAVDWQASEAAVAVGESAPSARVAVPATGSTSAPAGPGPVTDVRPSLTQQGASAGQVADGGPPLLPWFRLACRKCGAEKHLLESICPHCRRADGRALVAAALLSVLCLGLVFDVLPGNEPSLLAGAGWLAALLAMITVPATAGLLAHILTARQPSNSDVAPGPRWPAVNQVCCRCGRVNVMQLFACRLCGRMSWVTLAVAAAVALTSVCLVLASQPDADAALWWVTPVVLLRWLGRLVGVIFSFLLVVGTFEAWKLQERLPPEARIRSQAGQMALLAATLLPLVCAAMLFFSLFSWVPARPPGAAPSVTPLVPNPGPTIQGDGKVPGLPSRIP